MRMSQIKIMFATAFMVFCLSVFTKAHDAGADVEGGSNLQIFHMINEKINFENVKVKIDLGEELPVETINKDNWDFAHCYNGYADFSDPRSIDYELLETLCGFIELLGLTYIHHSDVRFKSLHASGDAIDGRFQVPSGVHPTVFFREVIVGLWYYLLATEKYQYGLGFYLDSNHLFFHIDNGKGVKPNRRWSRINGVEVSFGKGIDELIRRARQTY